MVAGWLTDYCFLGHKRMMCCHVSVGYSSRLVRCSVLVQNIRFVFPGENAKSNSQQMAGASTLPPPFTTERCRLTLSPSNSATTFSPFIRCSSIIYLRNSTRFKIPRLAAPSAKLNESMSDGPDEMEESFFGGDVLIDDESDDEDEAESSIDLLFRFFQSMFKKVSKRAKKASRSVLPGIISPQLVSFAVDGFLLLASLSIVKALLEVVCTLGGTVFVVILLLRVIWAAVAYFQSNSTTFNQGGTSYGTT